MSNGSKKWYASKTLWLNLIFLGAFIYQSYTGFAIELEVQAAALILINFVLRAVTKEPLEW